MEEPKKEDNDSGSKENDNANFGIVTNEDKEADQEAMDKLTSMIEERLKTKPLPPPPVQASGGDGTGKSELPAKSRDGDSDADMRNGNVFIKEIGIVVIYFLIFAFKRRKLIGCAKFFQGSTLTSA